MHLTVRLNSAFLSAALMTCFCTAVDVQADDSPASQWKSRAFKSADALSRIQDELSAFSEEDWNSAASRRPKCEAMLESAYALHVTQEDIVHKRDKDVEVFYIDLNGGDSGLLILGYVYDLTGRLLVSRIDHLPDGWRLTFGRPEKLYVLMPNNGCMWQFDMWDPFKSHVMVP